MQLSDWLAIIGIFMSTIMSVISIAVALRVHRKEQDAAKQQRDRQQQDGKDGQQAKRQAQAEEDRRVGFFTWLIFDVVKDLVKEFVNLVFDTARRTASSDEVPTERTTSSEEPDRHAKSTEEQPPPPKQQQGKSVDGPSTDVPQQQRIVNNPWGQNTRTGRVVSNGITPDDTGSKQQRIIRHAEEIKSSNHERSSRDSVNLQPPTQEA